MSLDLTGIGAAATAIKGIVDKFMPDKTEQERQAAAYQMQQLIGEQAAAQAQAAIDQAEAASPDRVNHWRGGLGWTLTASFAWEYVFGPMIKYACAILHVQAAFPALDTSAMYPLLFAMLGVTGAHVYQQVKS